MSILTDWLVGNGAQTSSEADEHYAQQQREFEAALERRRQAGSISAEQDARSRANTEDELISQDVGALEGAAEGLSEGWNNVLNAPGKAVGAVGDNLGQALGGVLKNVPLWAWLAAAVALFVWMGGLALLRGRLAR